MLFLKVKSRNAVNLAMKHANFCFTTFHSAVFGKVRELVGEFKYAFVVRSNKVVGINELHCWHGGHSILLVDYTRLPKNLKVAHNI